MISFSIKKYILILVFVTKFDYSLILSSSMGKNFSKAIDNFINEKKFNLIFINNLVNILNKTNLYGVFYCGIIQIKYMLK
jgi:hypothetical protein